jgi:hypothetical protein
MARGQAYTLEAIVAALLLLSAIFFALDMTAVTPLSASTSSQHIENQQQGVARGVLTATAADDGLTESILYWDNHTGAYHNSTDLGYYTNDVPNTTLGVKLNRSFDQNDVAYNVYLAFESDTGDRIRRRFIYRGVPSNNAVSASRTVVITDDERLFDRDLTRNETVVDSTSFYAPDVGGVVYNVFDVEVVAWRV